MFNLSISLIIVATVFIVICLTMIIVVLRGDCLSDYEHEALGALFFISGCLTGSFILIEVLVTL